MSFILISHPMRPIMFDGAWSGLSFLVLHTIIKLHALLLQDLDSVSLLIPAIPTTPTLRIRAK